MDCAIQKLTDKQGQYLAFIHAYSLALGLDAVIRPRDTRRKLIQALEMLENKRDKNPPKKHGNIPL